MNSSTPRRRFQFSLRTLIILFTAASALLALNLRGRDAGVVSVALDIDITSLPPIATTSGSVESRWYHYGWPTVHAIEYAPLNEDEWTHDWTVVWRTTQLAVNIFVCLAILGVSTVSCEIVIRRFSD